MNQGGLLRYDAFFNSCKIHIPYLGLHNAQDFAQNLYCVGGERIINRNNVFHSFPDREITCPPCFTTKSYMIAYDLLLLWTLLPSNFKDENIF